MVLAEKMKRINLIKSILIIAIIVAGVSMWCLTFLSLSSIGEEPEVTISVSIPEEIMIPPSILERTVKISYDNKQADFRADVERFLANDSTNNNAYIYPDYCCTHFATDLILNMQAAGFDAHKLILRTKGKIGHAMIFIYGPDCNLIVEPITDQVFDINSEIDEYFHDTLGYHPEIIKICI